MTNDDLVASLGTFISRGRPNDELAPLASAPVPQLSWNVGQRAAIQAITFWRSDPAAPRFMKLTGAAGTGKSTVMRAVRECLRGSRTAWAAMTGKAATRLREASGVAGRTLHSVLYHPPREVDNAPEQKIDLEFEHVRPDGRSCLLVIDEASMIGPRLRADIERSSYDKVLVVGDPYQIPPVLSKQEEAERGADYSVFSDVTGPHLDEVMRAGGAVLAAATYVREKQAMPSGSSTDGGSTYEYLGAATDDVALGLAVMAWFSDPEDHVLITWRNEQRLLASKVIRAKLGKKGLPEPGEPMVVRKNVYAAGLMNGDVVRVVRWNGDGPTLAGIPTAFIIVAMQDGSTVELLVPSDNFTGSLPYVALDVWKKALYDADVDDVVPLTFAYCLTGHLSQGSEYRRVTTFLPGDLSNPHFRKPTRLPDGNSMLFSARFVYTALSRAKQHSTLIISR